MSSQESSSSVPETVFLESGSPIARCPPEILREIFRSAILGSDSYCPVAFSPVEPPTVPNAFLLSHVRTTWREVVLSDGCCASSMYILLSRMTLARIRYSERWATSMRNIHYMKITLHLISLGQPSSSPSETILDKIFDAVVLVFPQCSRIHLSLRPEHAVKFADVLREVEEFPSLCELQLEADMDSKVDTAIISNILGGAFDGKNTPGLMQIGLDTGWLTRGSTIKPSVLSLRGPHRLRGSRGCVPSCLQALRQAPSLRICSLELFACTICCDHFTVARGEIMSLPQLVSLSVYSSDNFPDWVPRTYHASFWKPLILPSLQRLLINAADVRSAADMLQRSRCSGVRRLKTCACTSESVSHITELLQCTPHLEKFEIVPSCTLAGVRPERRLALGFPWTDAPALRQEAAFAQIVISAGQMRSRPKLEFETYVPGQRFQQVRYEDIQISCKEQSSGTGSKRLQIDVARLVCRGDSQGY